MRCYNSSQLGHMAKKCPKNALFCGVSQAARKTLRDSQARMTCGGIVEWKYVKDIVLDTRCSRTLIWKELVPPKKMLEGKL